ncbi:GNAT family N-acetyltransferase [Patescibacteria group bacterium]
MKIINKRYCDWDKNIQRELLCATFKDGFIRKVIEFNPDQDTFVAYYGGKIIIGWALIFKTPYGDAVEIFINKEFRNQGFGRVLIEEIITKYKKIILAKHNKVTNYLFSKLESEYPNNISAIQWTDEVKEKFYNLVGYVFIDVYTCKEPTSS